MVSGRQARIVLVTCSSLAEARRIAHVVIAKRLAACANIHVSRVESIYRWKGRVEQAREFLVVLKTTARRLAALEKKVKRLHSYDVPEFIALSVVAGSREYLRWLRDSVNSTEK